MAGVGELGSLFGQDRRSGTLDACPEDQAVAEQDLEAILADRDRVDRDGAAGMELDEVEAPERRRVLVLLADRMTQPVDLDGAGLFRQLGGRDILAPQRMQGIKQPHREGRG